MELLDRISSVLVRHGHRGAFNFHPLDLSLLPNELVVKIIRSLDAEALKTCRCVCKEWDSIIVAFFRSKRLLLEITRSFGFWEVSLGTRQCYHRKMKSSYYWNFPTFSPFFRFQWIRFTGNLLNLAILTRIIQSPCSDIIRTVEFKISEINWNDPELNKILDLLMNKSTFQNLYILTEPNEEKEESASFLTKYKRYPHRKLYQLALWEFTASYNDVIYFLDHVCENLWAKVYFSLDEFDRIVKFLISKPREAFLESIYSDDIYKLVEYVTDPKFSQFTVSRMPTNNGYRLDINAHWKLIVHTCGDCLDLGCWPASVTDLPDTWWDGRC